MSHLDNLFIGVIDKKALANRSMRLFFLTCLMMIISSVAFAGERESAYDRVMRTGVLRCGYSAWEPIIMKDPNTGQFSGVYSDYMTAMGRRLGLKVEWQEINMAMYLDDLRVGKIDVECSGGWPNARRGKFADYSTPLFYTPIYLFAAGKDHRFDNHYNKINDPTVRFVTMPGEQSEDYRTEFFPKSQEISVPPSSMLSDILLQIAMGKADVAFWDLMTARNFMKANPGKIRIISGDVVKVIPNNLSVAKGETKLLSMLNIATEELISDGVIEQIMQKYDLTPDVAFRPAKPYIVAH